jgi:hypothetical protein
VVPDVVRSLRRKERCDSLLVVGILDIQSSDSSGSFLYCCIRLVLGHSSAFDTLQTSRLR